METLKKVLHPHSASTTTTNPSHPDTDTTDTTTTAHTHPDAATQAALGNEPNVTGTDRVAPSSSEIHHESHDHNKQPRAGHHHPRQPVGATGLPPNHKPRSDFVHHEEQADGRQQQQTAGVTGAEAGLEGGDVHRMGKVVAESGNNFPGTNPHPTHSALGNKDAEGVQGTLNPGRE